MCKNCFILLCQDITLIKEIINASKNISTPIITAHLENDMDQEKKEETGEKMITTTYHVEVQDGQFNITSIEGIR